MSNPNMPEDFGPLIEKLNERRPIANEIILNIQQEIHWLETHPLVPPPEALIRSMNAHVRDQKVIRRRWEVFIEKIRGVKTADLTEEQKEEISSTYYDILETMKRAGNDWGDIKYELDAWKESLEEIEAMVQSQEELDEWQEEAAYEDDDQFYASEEDYEEDDYADEDNDDFWQ